VTDGPSKSAAMLTTWAAASRSVNPPTFWDNPPDAPSPSCGLQAVLYALECNMRAMAEAAPASTPRSDAEDAQSIEARTREAERKLGRARAVVFVCAEALDGGDSDLELQSVEALQQATMRDRPPCLQRIRGVL